MRRGPRRSGTSCAFQGAARYLFGLQDEGVFTASGVELAEMLVAVGVFNSGGLSDALWRYLGMSCVTMASCGCGSVAGAAGAVVVDRRSGVWLASGRSRCFYALFFGFGYSDDQQFDAKEVLALAGEKVVKLQECMMYKCFI